MSFSNLLQNRFDKQLFVCVGLDSVVEKLPSSITSKYSSIEDQLFYFNKAIIDATAEFVCAFKPNSAFYEAYGIEGISGLKKTCDYIKSSFPDIPIIIDAKRGDIGNTNNAYAKFAFDYLHADAITVHPYLGKEAVQPFLDRAEKGIIVLVKTSNSGAGEFQDLPIVQNSKNPSPSPSPLGRGLGEGQVKPLYQVVAENVTKNWNTNNNCAVVVGATYAEELAKVREIIGDMPILIPGIGAQGGDVASTVGNGKNSKGQGMIISSSRGIIYASSGKDFAQAAGKETEKLSNEIKKYL